MTHLAPLLLRACLFFACAFPGLAQAPPSAPPAAGYVCTPCRSACDQEVHTAPGACTHCGMKLVPAETKPAPHLKVAILIFPGVEIIDFAGPYEMFGTADMEVFTVAATRAPLETSMGLTLVPAQTFSDAPRADVLVVPGGAVGATAQDAPTLAYVKGAHAQGGLTMSVCNGAFILAATGLLDGLQVTTTRGNLTKLATRFPKLKVVPHRFTDNGRIVTTAGLSAGMDGALHVIERLKGKAVAREVATIQEYRWLEDPTAPQAPVSQP